jgi:WD40 repeat protein
VNTGKPLIDLEGHGDAVRSAAFSPDGTLIVTASEDQTVRIWNAETGKPVSTPWQLGAIVYSAAFSPDGRHIVTAVGDRTARVFDAASGVTESVLMGHNGHVFWAEFSPDGERIVTASEDETARVWHRSTLDAFAAACASLGTNTELSDLAGRYGLTELTPICGSHAPDKIDLAKLRN